MMRFAAFLLTFCAITPAFALHCKNDYAGSAGCAANATPAGDCTTLGFSKSDVAGCDQYLYCMFDTSYKRCISKSESCPTGYGKTTKDCGRYSAGWTLGTLDSSGCGKCMAAPCPSGSATSGAGCPSGKIKNETAGAVSGNNLCYVCQTVTCSTGYATEVKDCGGMYNGSGYKLDKFNKDANGCYKCVEKTCEDYGYLPASAANDGYHLCKMLGDGANIVLGDVANKYLCQDCVPCSACTNCPTVTMDKEQLNATNANVYAHGDNVCGIAGTSSFYPVVVRVKEYGSWKDSQGRTASFCRTIGNSQISAVGSNVEILGCCKDGRVTWDKTVMGGITINASNCPSR